MGADRGVREALAKVSNIIWLRLVPARSIATQSGRPGELQDAMADDLVVAVTHPMPPRHSIGNRDPDDLDHAFEHDICR